MRKPSFPGATVPLVLITVVFGKEEAAKLEVLDCIFQRDPRAKFLAHPFGGLLLLETSLDADSTASMIRDSTTSHVYKIIPVDAFVDSNLDAISKEALRLVGVGPSSISVECKRRGKVIASSSDVEQHVGKLLKEAGHLIDLEKPDLIVRIDIIGERTTITVRPPDGFFTKMRGMGDERAPAGQGSE